MKKSDFLKGRLIANKGIYDNRSIYENTLESFRAAIAKNYIIHFSIQSTKDKVLVVYHDEDLTRLMNLKDKISTTTYEELSYICSYHIPTLEETLSIISGKVPIIINPRGNNKYLRKELARILDEYQGLFAIVSANPNIIKWFNKNKPDYSIGEILNKKNRFHLNNIFAHYSIITDFKSINIENYDILKIKKLKETSLILGYLVNNQEKYDLFKDVCDGIFIENINEIDFK